MLFKLLLVLIVFINLAFIPVLYEKEPNNTPVKATSFSGETFINAKIKKGDQDAFMWKVSEKDSKYSWNIELIGVPNAMTRIDIMKIIFTKDKKSVEDYKKIFSFGTKTGNKPVNFRNILLKSGEYLIAVSSNSPKMKNYKINITKDEKYDSTVKKSKEYLRYLGINDFEHYIFKDNSGWFSFNINNQFSKKLLAIKASFTIAKNAKITLLDQNDKKIAEAKSNKYGKARIKNLELEEGKYFIKYEGSEKGLQAGFKIYSTGAQKISENEVEPNNDYDVSNNIDYKKNIHGETNKDGDYDYFSFNLPNKFKDKVFDIKLTTDSKDLKFYLYDDRQNKLLERGINSKYAMNSLMLDVESSYIIKIEGDKKGEKYNLKFSEPRVFNRNQELEPNDTSHNAHKIDLNKVIKGSLDSNEYDCFKFSIEESDKIWEIKASIKKGRLIFRKLNEDILYSSNLKDGKIMLKNLFLLRGDYLACLTADEEIRDYTLKVSEIPLSELNITSFDEIEHEPNQNKAQSNLLKFNKTIKGTLEHTNGGDFFHFTLLNDEYIRITAIPPKDGDSRIKLISSLKSIRAYPERGKVSSLEGRFPAGDYLIDLWTEKPSNKMYSLKLERLNPFKTEKKDISELKNLSLKVKIKNSNFSTYSDYGQVINVDVKVKNLSNKNQKYNIDTHISDNSWKILGKKSVILKAKQKKTLSFKLVAPKNLNKTEIVTTLKFTDKKGSFQTTSLILQAKENSEVLNPYIDWGVPNKLLGGLNVARLDFGAKRVVSDKETKKGFIPEVGYDLHKLFDDTVYRGNTSLSLYSGRKSDTSVVVKTLGKNSSELIGVSLIPAIPYTKENLKEFYISISKDGKNYKEIYKGKLTTENKEQFFSFDKVYFAKYVKLTLHSNQNDKTRDEIFLDEWKVIAKQDSLKLESAFNIASDKLGGHIVKASKVLTSDWDRDILTKEKEDPLVQPSESNEKIYWVLAFRNERIAKITSMKWIDILDKRNRIKNFKIFISTQTPNGPWKEMKEWNRDKKDKDIYNFEKPTWARYIKFVTLVNEVKFYDLPEELQVFEEKPSKSYKSILGEWGDRNYRAFYEYQLSKSNKKLNIITGNDTKKKSFSLKFNKKIKGNVSIANNQKDWYKIKIPKGNNQLKLIFDFKEGVNVNYELFDKKNNLIKPVKEIKNRTKHVFIFDVSKRAYYLKVKQPPISVVFAWDNSGSVSIYRNHIFKAVNNYIKNMKSGIDSVNLICFNRENKFILSDFSSTSSNVQEGFNNFDWKCSDSDAEMPLRVSSLKLKDRIGTKGVIIIGDAIGGRNIKLWETLKEVKPKVFSIRVQSQHHDNYLYEGIMQSWARVNNGEYFVVNDGKEIYKAINLATAILRRPVYYNLEIKSSYKKPLENGSLEILNKKLKIDKNFAVELILDASGSMLKKIKGKKRIAIARDVLKKAVTDIIPDKTLVAFRVFGHKKRGSCQTDLEVKLQTLDKEKMNQVIDKIEAKNLAKTPIAASLAKIASDLADVKGKKVVILVTDGKETCKGNPAKEIKALKAKGFDIRLNIVGFAINNKKLKKQFASWAKLGDGDYFNAKDESSLENAIKKALQIPYKIYDKNNKFILKGIVGEKTEIKPGVYKVIVETSPENIFKNIKIDEGKSIKINLEDKK